MLKTQITLSVILVYRIALLAYLSLYDIVDYNYFTYQTYAFTTFIIAVSMALLRQPRYASAAFLALVPIAFAVQAFIAIAITVIVVLDDFIFLRSTFVYGAANSVGVVNAANLLLHYSPVVELAVVMGLLAKKVEATKFTKASDRVLYALMLTFVPTLYIGFYCINFDFMENYPTALELSIVLLLMFGVSFVTNILVTLMYVIKS